MIIQKTPHVFSRRTRHLLKKFKEITKNQGYIFKSLDKIVYYALHLAITHICIGNLEKELEEYENNHKELIIPKNYPENHEKTDSKK